MSDRIKSHRGIYAAPIGLVAAIQPLLHHLSLVP